jgi:chemotaxis protein CheX
VPRAYLSFEARLRRIRSMPGNMPAVMRAGCGCYWRGCVDDVLKLPENLDVAAARVVMDTLLGLRGGAVSVDAGDVRKASGLALEVLVSAVRQWREDGQIFRIGPVSESFRASWTGLSLESGMISAELTGSASA